MWNSLEICEFQPNPWISWKTDVIPWAPHLQLAVLFVFSGFMTEYTRNPKFLWKSVDFQLEICRFQGLNLWISMDSHLEVFHIVDEKSLSICSLCCNKRYNLSYLINFNGEYYASLPLSDSDCNSDVTLFSTIGVYCTISTQQLWLQ